MAKIKPVPLTRLALALDDLAAGRDEPALIINRRGRLPPLYCIDALMVFPSAVAEQLGSEQPIIAFRAPTLSTEARDPPTSVSEWAAAYLDIIRQQRLPGPYRLLGWCVGSLIAFEMARQLVAERQQITRLILVDPPARPFGGDQLRTLSDPVFMRTLSDPVFRIFPSLEATELSERLKDYCKAMDRTLLALHRLSRNYRPAPYRDEVVILCSEEQCPRLIAETSEWRAAVRGVLRVSKIAPNHRSIMDTHRPELGAHLRHLLGTGN